MLLWLVRPGIALYRTHNCSVTKSGSWQTRQYDTVTRWIAVAQHSSRVTLEDRKPDEASGVPGARQCTHQLQADAKGGSPPSCRAWSGVMSAHSRSSSRDPVQQGRS